VRNNNVCAVFLRHTHVRGATCVRNAQLRAFTHHAESHPSEVLCKMIPQGRSSHLGPATTMCSLNNAWHDTPDVAVRHYSPITLPYAVHACGWSVRSCQRHGSMVGWAALQLWKQQQSTHNQLQPAFSHQVHPITRQQLLPAQPASQQAVRQCRCRRKRSNRSWCLQRCCSWFSSVCNVVLMRSHPAAAATLPQPPPHMIFAT
jgi:hypothetical protein